MENKLIIHFYNLNQMNLDSFLSNDIFSYEDREWISRFKNEQAQKEHSFSLYVKKKYIPDFQVNSFHKPVSSSCFFNISHSNGYLIYAISKQREIGLDLELIRAVSPKLLDYVCSEEEKRNVIDDASFYKMWTSKEALVKCQGKGFIKDFKDTPALPLIGVVPYLEDSYYRMQTIFSGFVVSIVSKGNKPFEFEIIEESI